MELRMMSRSIRVTGQENVYEAQVRWPEIELSGASLADDPSSAACSAARAKFGLGVGESSGSSSSSIEPWNET